MKIRSVVPLVGLAISFALPTFAQREPLTSEEMRKADPLAEKYSKAVNDNDPAAVAALFAEDAVFITPQGAIVGPEAIRKQYEEWFKDRHYSNHTSTYDPGFYYRDSADLLTFSGSYSATIEPTNGKPPYEVKGYWLRINVRVVDGWRIWKLAYNLIPPSSPTASPSSQ